MPVAAAGGGSAKTNGGDGGSRAVWLIRAAQIALLWAVAGAAVREPERLFSYHPILAVVGVLCTSEAMVTAVDLRTQTGPIVRMPAAGAPRRAYF